jgi:hypothetical protein
MALIGVQVIKPRIENWTDKISYMGKSRTTQTRHGCSKDLNQKNRISSFQKKTGGKRSVSLPAIGTGPRLR